MNLSNSGFKIAFGVNNFGKDKNPLDNKTFVKWEVYLSEGLMQETTTKTLLGQHLCDESDYNDFYPPSARD